MYTIKKLSGDGVRLETDHITLRLILDEAEKRTHQVLGRGYLDKAVRENYEQLTQVIADMKLRLAAELGKD